MTIARLLMCGALSDKRTGLSFTTAAGPRQRSHSRVRVPWDLRPYFTVSDSSLPFSSPPTTPRVTVEVFSPASTRDNCYSLYILCTDRTENATSKRSSLVAWRHYWRGLHKRHRFQQLLLLRVTQPLLSNGGFSVYPILALGKYDTILFLKIYICYFECHSSHLIFGSPLLWSLHVLAM
jgi:hypothetical protein